jgi:hypothetical protein
VAVSLNARRVMPGVLRLSVMNLLRNKVLLKWREPRFWWKHVQKHLSWSDWLRYYLKFIVKCVLVVVGIGATIRLVRGDVELLYQDLTSFVLVGLGIGIGLSICFMGWLVSKSPVEIQIREKNIVRVTGGGNQLIAYKDVRNCSVREVEVDGQKFEVLEVKYWDGNECALEIAPSVSSDAVLEKLREAGVQTTPRRTSPQSV